MTTYNIVAVIIITLAVVAIAALRIFSMKKNNEDISIENFINMYSNTIINILKDFIKVMQTSIENYETKEEYNKVLVELCVQSIKENSAEFGIDSKLLDLFNTEAIVECVCKILESNKIECFSVLDAADIKNNEKYFDEDVVVALSEAEGTDETPSIVSEIIIDNGMTEEDEDITPEEIFEEYTISEECNNECDSIEVNTEDIDSYNTQIESPEESKEEERVD